MYLQNIEKLIYELINNKNYERSQIHKTRSDNRDKKTCYNKMEKVEMQ